MEIINDRLSELDLKRKIRSDAILMNSFVITSDGEFFKGLPPWEQREFFRDCVQFFSDKYGEENMISAIVHRDETTPHMHLNFIPINQGRLSSKSLFDRQKLAQLQTQLHESIGRKWGLKRGKEGSQAKHLSTAEFKAKKIIEGAEQREREIDEQTEKKRAELDDLTKAVQTVEDAKNKPIPKKRKDAEKEIVSLRTTNAEQARQLQIVGKDRDYISQHFAECVIKKNKLKKIRFHDLRHSCATLLRREGVPMEDIQKWLGHSQITITNKLYAHFEYGAHLKSAEKIGKALEM